MRSENYHIPWLPQWCHGSKGQVKREWARGPDIREETVAWTCILFYSRSKMWSIWRLFWFIYKSENVSNPPHWQTLAIWQSLCLDILTSINSSGLPAWEMFHTSESHIIWVTHRILTPHNICYNCRPFSPTPNYYINITNKNCVVKDYCVKFNHCGKGWEHQLIKRKDQFWLRVPRFSVHSNLVFLLWSSVRQRSWQKVCAEEKLLLHGAKMYRKEGSSKPSII